MSRKPRPRRASPRPRPTRRLAGLLVLGALTLAAVLGLAGALAYRGPGPAAPRGEVTSVILQRGSGVAKIADTLADAGVIRSRQVFVLAARLSGAAGQLKAGEYEFKSRTPMSRVLADIRAGRVVRHMITIPEGWTSEMAAEAVNRHPVLTGHAEPPPEGAILPDTYQVERGDDRAAVIGRMRKARDTLLAELWAKRQPGLPVHTPEEAVILASIVEKETAIAAERPRIAAVFVNRLERGMRLESDPTIIYGITKGRALGRGIRLSEIGAATPYNTYLIAGLPPTPIANPGRESLAAVLDPPKTDELFFVADGSGGHVFASSFDEHLKNVARWRQVERARAAAERGGAAR